MDTPQNGSVEVTLLKKIIEKIDQAMRYLAVQHQGQQAALKARGLLLEAQQIAFDGQQANGVLAEGRKDQQKALSDQHLTLELEQATLNYQQAKKMHDIGQHLAGIERWLEEILEKPSDNNS